MKKFLIFTLVSLIVNTNIIYAECTTKDTEYFKREVYDLVGDEYEVLGEYVNTHTKIKLKLIQIKLWK